MRRCFNEFTILDYKRKNNINKYMKRKQLNEFLAVKRLSKIKKYLRFHDVQQSFIKREYYMFIKNYDEYVS